MGLEPSIKNNYCVPAIYTAIDNALSHCFAAHVDDAMDVISFYPSAAQESVDVYDNQVQQGRRRNGLWWDYLRTFIRRGAEAGWAFLLGHPILSKFTFRHLLKTANCDLNCEYNGMTPFMANGQRGDMEKVAVLLGHGVNIDAPSTVTGLSAVDTANENCMPYLLATQDFSASAINDDVETCKRLVANASLYHLNCLQNHYQAGCVRDKEGCLLGLALFKHSSVQIIDFMDSCQYWVEMGRAQKRRRLHSPSLVIGSITVLE
jgi:hypothetical protein